MPTCSPEYDYRKQNLCMNIIYYICVFVEHIHEMSFRDRHILSFDSKTFDVPFQLIFQSDNGRMIDFAMYLL